MIAAFTLVAAFTAPLSPISKMGASKVSMHGGKGFGGGEATRDPTPTEYDPNDPKGKQQAIHKAESFAEYLAKRGAGGAAPPPPPEPEAAAPSAPSAPLPGTIEVHTGAGKGFGGGEATRNPEATAVDP